VAIAELPPAIRETNELGADARGAFGRRILAVVVDILVLSIVDFIINGVFGVTHVVSGSPVPPLGGGFTDFASATDVGWFWLTLIWVVYYLSLEALFGATVGKWALGLRVTDREGRRPRLGQILVRNLVRVVDALPVGYLIGGGVALLSSGRQRLGDHAAHTLVLPKESVTEPLLTPAHVRRRLTLVSVALLIFLAFSGAFFYYDRPPLVVQGMVNTRQMMFSDGVSSYTLDMSSRGSGTVTYAIEYVTEHPVNTCHTRLTLTWAPPTGWEPRYAVTSCDMHAP
jgi:uncharacterized RDD family membrane protein YckC